MKNIISIVFLTFFFILSLGSCKNEGQKAKRPHFTEAERTGLEVTNERPKVDNINLNTFKEFYNSGLYMIIDARTQKEFMKGHLPEAILLDIDATDFDKIADGLDSSRAYLIYSTKGIRSVKAMTKLKSKGLNNITNLIGGITGWQLKKYPWTK